MKKSISYRKHLLEDLKDPVESAAYLNAAIEAGDLPAFLLALKNVVDAQAQVTTVARQMRVHRVSLHKMLSAYGNPGSGSLIALFRILGIRLIFEKPRAPSKEFRKAA